MHHGHQIEVIVTRIKYAKWAIPRGFIITETYCDMGVIGSGGETCRPILTSWLVPCSQSPLVCEWMGEWEAKIVQCFG